MAALNIRSCFIEMVDSGERPIYLRRPGHEEDYAGDKSTWSRQLMAKIWIGSSK
jgi:hypothetical protein